MCDDDELKHRIQQGLEGEISALKTEVTELKEKVKGCATLTNTAQREAKEQRRRAEEWAVKLQLIRESVEGITTDRNSWKEKHNQGLRSLAETICKQRDEAHAKTLRCFATVNRLVIQNRDLRTGLDNLRQAWAENWDCSANPGHEGMGEPMVAAIEILERPPTHADKILAAMEKICEEAGLTQEGNSMHSDLAKALAALDAAKKGEA